MAKPNQIQECTDVTLDDIYQTFSNKKKHYATRLRHAFSEHHIEKTEDLLALSINDILDMDGIGSDTIRLLIKKLHTLGIDYYPIAKQKDQ